MKTFTVQLTFTGDEALDAKTTLQALKHAAVKHEDCFGFNDEEETDSTTAPQYALKLCEKLADEVAAQTGEG